MIGLAATQPPHTTDLFEEWVLSDTESTFSEFEAEREKELEKFPEPKSGEHIYLSSHRLDGFDEVFVNILSAAGVVKVSHVLLYDSDVYKYSFKLKNGGVIYVELDADSVSRNPRRAAETLLEKFEQATQGEPVRAD